MKIKSTRNRFGRGLRSCFLLCAFCWCALSAAAADRVALVIGNADYENLPATQQLFSPDDDAKAVAKALSGIGYRVVGGDSVGDPVIDATRAEMVEAIEAFSNAAAGADGAVFYFSGHGIQVGEEQYLIPSDSPRITGASVLNTRTLNLRESVMVALEERQVKTKVLILDCCRENPFAAQLEAAFQQIGKSLRTKSLGEITGYGPGFYLAFATSPGGLADDGNGRLLSPFTEAMLKALPESGGKDVDFFFRAVKGHLEGEHVPWTSHSLGHEFRLAGASIPHDPAVLTALDLGREMLAERQAIAAVLTKVTRAVAEEGEEPLESAERSAVNEVYRRGRILDSLASQFSKLKETLSDHQIFEVNQLLDSEIKASWATMREAFFALPGGEECVELKSAFLENLVFVIRDQVALGSPTANACDLTFFSSYVWESFRFAEACERGDYTLLESEDVGIEMSALFERMLLMIGELETEEEFEEVMKPWGRALCGDFGKDLAQKMTVLEPRWGQEDNPENLWRLRCSLGMSTGMEDAADYTIWYGGKLTRQLDALSSEVRVVEAENPRKSQELYRRVLRVREEIENIRRLTDVTADRDREEYRRVRKYLAEVLELYLERLSAAAARHDDNPVVDRHLNEAGYEDVQKEVANLCADLRLE